MVISRVFPTILLFVRALESFSLSSLYLFSLSKNELQMQHRQVPHPSTGDGGSASSMAALADAKRGKKRGSYNCGRCGLPKKGHSCSIDGAATPTDSSASTADPSPRQQYTHLRRALSFDDGEVKRSAGVEEEVVVEDEEEAGSELGGGGLPASCLWEVMRRLPPPAMLAAAQVCKGWRETARKLWRAAEELRLRVPASAQVGFVGSVLQKCPGLVRLSIRMERLGFLPGFDGTLSDLGFRWMVLSIMGPRM